MVYVALTGNFKKADKTYIVGLDGSEVRTATRIGSVCLHAIGDVAIRLTIRCNVLLCRPRCVLFRLRLKP